MAYVVNVQPTFNNAVKVVSNDAMNGTILSNSLTAEVLLNIWNTYPEMRAYLFLQWVDIAGSYPAGTINESLLHAYDTGEVSHNPTKMDYGTGSAGKHLNETRGIVDATTKSFSRSLFRPAIILDFLNSKFLDPKNVFTRNSIGSYLNEQGKYRLANINKPRFTHLLDTQSANGLLIESSRTNIYPNSEDLANALSNATFNGYTTLAGFRAFQFTLNATANSFVGKYIPFLANTTYTYSYLSTITNTSSVRLLNSSSVLLRSVPVVSELYALGIYKNTCTFTTNSDEVIGLFFAGRLDAQGLSFTVAAVQVEVSSFATSYIPTTSNTPVTRAVDRLSIPISSPDEFTLLVDIEMLSSLDESFVELRGPDTAGWNSVRIMSITGNKFAILMERDGQTLYNVQSIPLGATKGILVLRVAKEKQTLYFDGQIVCNNISNQAIPNNLSSINCNPLLGKSAYFLKKLKYWNIAIPEADCLTLSAGSDKVTEFDLGRSAFVRPESILRTTGRQEFTVHGTGASESRNIRRPYDFTFDVVDSSGVTTISAQPATNCTANTDNTLTANIPVGKSLVYAITPVYDN